MENIAVSEQQDPVKMRDALTELPLFEKSLHALCSGCHCRVGLQPPSRSSVAAAIV